MWIRIKLSFPFVLLSHGFALLRGNSFILFEMGVVQGICTVHLFENTGVTVYIQICEPGWSCLPEELQNNDSNSNNNNKNIVVSRIDSDRENQSLSMS